MNYTSLVQLKAKYNTRMNVQIYESALKLADEVLQKDQGAFFGSINGTLNHILVGDLLWFSRFSRLSKRFRSLMKISKLPQPSALNEILFVHTTELFLCRQKIDQLIEVWANTEIENQDFDKDLTYTNTRGEVQKLNFGKSVSHVFNHQTHHRGQVSTLLNQCGIDIGVTDFLIEIQKTA